jgi:hypothetical protein
MMPPVIAAAVTRETATMIAAAAGAGPGHARPQLRVTQRPGAADDS